MSSFSDHTEAQILNYLFGTTPPTRTSTLAIAALTAVADDTSTGQFSTTTGTEVSNSSTGYARVALASSDSNWTRTSGQAVHAVDIVFPTATGDWGTIVGIAIVDSATYDSGNVIGWLTLGTSKTINSGDVLEIKAGQLVVTLD